MAGRELDGGDHLVNRWRREFERRLDLPGLGKFDLDPQFDLRQDRVETGIAGRCLQVSGGITEPQYGCLVEIAGQQFQLELQLFQLELQ